jgi:hypothetical protein
MKKKTTTTEKRWLTAAEQTKIAKLQQSHMSYINRLSQNDKITVEAKRVLRSMLADLKSALSKSQRFRYH